ATAFAEKTGTFINSDRTVQLGRQAIDPPGEARPDLWIIQQLARRLGLDWPELTAENVFNEMRQCMDSIAGITWQRLQHESVTYPCRHEGDPGTAVLFDHGFPTADGKAKLFPAAIVLPDELPNRDYPWVLITGRQLEHWHTGSMTRRSYVLNELEPEPWVAVNPADLQNLGIPDGGSLRLTTRRGAITLHARSAESSMAGSVFMPFCYHEAAANILTNSALDPVAKIAEVKYCAVNLTAA
ncbi:MAG TPA: formate dehydrogenase subunit alpha, partial [Gammaproteobacteria bacterium]|nr:formate dehydrogenase subunit alpha [Gammaproteobacteria bacterium]